MAYKNKAIFWDRDGIINEIEVKEGKSLSPRRFKDFKVFPFIKDLLEETYKLGYLNLIFTNQPDISRLLMDKNELNKMHKFLMKNFTINKIYFCPHSDEDNCKCRKPLPGMILKGMKDFSLDLNKSIVIGDRITDIISGQLAGIKNLFLLKKNYSLNCYSVKDFPKYKTISDLREVPFILRDKL